MKVVCKNNQRGSIDSENNFENSVIDYSEHLIIDKVYEVLGTDVMDFNNPSEVYYSIVNEFGQQFWYSSNRFKSISDMREDKLTKIGI